jgi:hypothetical protein
MTDRNQRIKFDPPDLIDGRKSEPHFLGASSAEAEEELKSLLGQWQAPSAPRSLDQRILVAYRAQIVRSSFWRRLLTSSISLPVPAAAALAVILVLGAAALMRQGSAPEPQAPTIVERTRTVEVPVVQERVVPRIIYRERRPVLASQTKPSLAPESISLAMGGEENAQSYFTDTNLTGFQPNAEMKFKVIKKVAGNEK